MIIRKVESKDYKEIEKLENEMQIFHNKLRPEIYNKNEIEISEESFKKSINGIVKTIVAEENDKICGCLEYIIKENLEVENPGKTLQIVALIVKEEYRNNGIATMLINNVKEIAKKEECNFILLDVVDNNEVAKTLYENQGFKVRSIYMDYKI